MKKTTLSVVLATSLFFVGCGNDNNKNTVNADINASTESYIPYLKANHASYEDYDISTSHPKPTQDDATNTISWKIKAETEENAKNLELHLAFMLNQLKTGGTPRAWDKLFLLEAYMKQNHLYTTEVERSDTLITVNKVASNTCSYKVIKAHSDSVSGDFFARGVINVDYGSIAEEILNAIECQNMKADMETFIQNNLKIRGNL